MLGNKPPYTTMQQLNLDWILSKLKTLLRLVPDDGAVGQILRRTRDGAVWSDEQGGGGGGAVQSVNGKTGAVVLDAADVGALPDDYTPPVTSVNSKTGAVVLDAADVGALPDDYTPPVTSVNGQTGAVTVSVPVQSVNGKTGAVVLDAADVGALPDDYTPPVTSVNGQTGAVTVSVPVQSVNGKTGAVVLDAADVGALPDSVKFSTLHIIIPYTAEANANASANLKQAIDANMPTGYRFLGFGGYSTNYPRMIIVNMLYQDTSVSLFLTNLNAFAVSSSFECDVLITNLEE